jgi:hypothetical protein
MAMTKFRIGFALLIIILSSAALHWKQIFLQQIPIDYICELEATRNLPFVKFSQKSQYTWFIVTNRPQYENWLKDGLVLPPCDFSENYLIISQYKINGIYFSPKYVDECCGAPAGFADLDKLRSHQNRAYIYKMPKIALAQAFG